MRIRTDLIEILLMKNGSYVTLTDFFMYKINKSILHSIEKINYSSILKEINRINQKGTQYDVQSQSQKHIMCPSWIFAQKKVFIWVVLNLLHVKTVEIQNSNNYSYIEDQQFALEINEYFPAQPFTFISYQLREFAERYANRMWNVEQQQILREIVQHLYPSKIDINWKTIAYSLFLKSQRRFYRTFHQIRQKWLNYFDSSVKKGKWTPQQDLQLFQSIQQWGKRWSKVSREIGKSRTEHMVKNRFNSLLKKNKELISSLNQEETLQFLLQQAKNNLLNLTQDNKNINNNPLQFSSIKPTNNFLSSKSRKPRSKVKPSNSCQSLIMTDLQSKSSFNGISYQNLIIQNQQSNQIKIDWQLDDNHLFFRTELFHESMEQVLNFQYHRDFQEDN